MRNLSRERTLLDACGTRPVRRLALLMAQLGPLPTVAEMRTMVRAGCTVNARLANEKRRATQRAAITKLRRRGATCCGCGG
jgi:hypothetical protein